MRFEFKMKWTKQFFKFPKINFSGKKSFNLKGDVYSPLMKKELPITSEIRSTANNLKIKASKGSKRKKSKDGEIAGDSASDLSKVNEEVSKNKKPKNKGQTNLESNPSPLTFVEDPKIFNPDNNIDTDFLLALQKESLSQVENLKIKKERTPIVIIDKDKNQHISLNEALNKYTLLENPFTKSNTVFHNNEIVDGYHKITLCDNLESFQISKGLIECLKAKIENICIDETTSLTMYFDGACKHKLRKGYAGVICYLNKESFFTIKASLGPQTTNNVAEYTSLIYGLCLVNLALGKKNILCNIFSDSELVVRQVLGKYKVLKPHLYILYKTVLSLMSQQKYSLNHVLRERNTVADGLANSAVRLPNKTIEFSYL